ncbi:MAG: energy transducer TonB [Betaproteobacteria bacterium HGW-Betaproteobacteria-8]|nr:MAG: energy transducer TonB [Betaproteobacteria bacterium HGW-Betaproteobacteria-8]
MTVSIPDFSVQQQLASERLFPAFCLALALHAGLFLLLPSLEHASAPAQVRIAVQMAQMREVAPSAQPEPPQPESPQQPVTPPKPVAKPEKVNKPILATKNEMSPAQLEVPVFEEQAEATEEKAVTPSPPPVQASSESTDTPPSSEASSQSGAPGEPDPNAQFEVADQNEAWKGYGQLLHDMISKNKTYPQIAIRRNLQGTVLVSARFSKGRLVEIVLLEPGSGHKVLDDAARAMLKKAVEALPVRGDLSRKSFTVVVPVDFKLES